MYIGILNGFLPCGLVYMAIMAAITVGSVFHGILYMILFGFGTLPMMMALGFGGNLVSARFRTFKKVVSCVYDCICSIIFDAGF